MAKLLSRANLISQNAAIGFRSTLIAMLDVGKWRCLLTVQQSFEVLQCTVGDSAKFGKQGEDQIAKILKSNCKSKTVGNFDCDSQSLDGLDP